MKKEYDFTKAKRGAVAAAPAGKTRVTIRLDNEVLDWFRKQVDDAGGGNYQTLFNDALLEHIRTPARTAGNDNPASNPGGVAANRITEIVNDGNAVYQRLSEYA